ncbi:hypothetical protein PFICI_07999 [Pestalotiopsis fici W106-1]|uniref:Endo-chitosanase n=1 Tax=Pestalotiopsis fici (strain W106-1 / CGMCC3.15140) TaxID=1229662 RepID=W3X314_PESFW|nr:uncharacterized protein PFICI_07999 [Pestalotiopsis fici W106-1]ETS80470.1 hypothetical protein PFICI_07999 [Pestalotiopsis fici W106-1]
MIKLALLISSLLAWTTLARDVPSNVKSLYDEIKSTGKCSDSLASGFYSTSDGANSWTYCGDHLDMDGIIYIQGTNGQFTNMDIDCDGKQHGPGNDGRCGYSADTQSQTSFQEIVAGYERGINDLNPYVHPYVVFGNVGTKSGYTNFDPQSHGIEPLSLMAVVCSDKLIYGIWGDENGDDGDLALVGEASISLATACFGDDMNGNSGHDDNDVLFIAFTGSDAVPGADGADWAAQSYDDFAQSIEALGDKLVERIGATGRNGGYDSGTAPSQTSSSSGARPTAHSGLLGGPHFGKRLPIAIE